MPKANTIFHLMKKYGLQPALKRNLSLFTVSCLVQGYTTFLREYAGFGYNAVAALSIKGSYHSMVNERYVAMRTARLISQHGKQLARVFDRAMTDFRHVEKVVKRLAERAEEDPTHCLEGLIAVFPSYFGALAVYNSFYRYTLVYGGQGRLSNKIFARIGRERNKIASLYPKYDALARRCLASLGTKEGVVGSLFSFVTADELASYLDGMPLTKKWTRQLQARSEGYFHLYLGDRKKEYLVTDPRIVRAVERKFFAPPAGMLTVNGTSAYTGVARGTVYNASLGGAFPQRKGAIFVAVHADPNFTHFIKQSRAIVVDEGGILSHAAVLSREFKIPCIIGTKIATKVLKDGDFVEVDANKGVVRIIKRAKV